ncbi:MAG: DUF4381 family protein [Chloroflexota bacterium]
MRMLLVALSLVGLMIVFQVSAQDTPAPPDDDLLGTVDARFIAQPSTPLVGEPVKLTLSVEYPEGVTLAAWPDFPTMWGIFEVQTVGPVESQDRAGLRQRSQVLQVVIWRTGDFSTPETFITYRVDATDELFRIPVREAFLSVPSVLETQDLNVLTLRPDRRPVGLFYVPPWVAFSLVVVVMVTIGVGLRLYRRRQHSPPGSTELPPDPPEVVALNRLRRLLQQAEADDALAATAETLRSYITARYGIATTNLTTTEWLASLRAHHLEPTTVDRLVEIVEQLELIRYADMSIDVEASHQLIRVAGQWIQQDSQRTGQDDE